MRIPHALRAAAGLSTGIDPRTVFDVKLWTGNSSTQTISGYGFSPDFVWLKCRSGSTEVHGLFDRVRDAQKSLQSNSSNAENSTDTNSLTAFTTDGFTVGYTSRFNESPNTYVGWAWDAGASNATNTDGTITSTVRANISAGFSIVSWTGNSTASTVGHGLGAVPKLIIVKNRDEVTEWGVYTETTGNANTLFLNLDNSSTSASLYWNNTSPTSDVFSVGSHGATNNSGKKIIAYCFAPVAGFSSFGSYTGNGLSTGPVVSGLGFEPYFLMIKCTSTTGDWFMYDAVRSVSNPRDKKLLANSSSTEDTSGEEVDFLTDGFQIKTTAAGLNTNAATYIYAAFA